MVRVHGGDVNKRSRDQLCAVDGFFRNLDLFEDPFLILRLMWDTGRRDATAIALDVMPLLFKSRPKLKKSALEEFE